MKEWMIALAVAVVYLAVSIVFQAWTWSWLIWVGYACYRFWKNSRHGRPV